MLSTWLYKDYQHKLLCKDKGMIASKKYVGNDHMNFVSLPLGMTPPFFSEIGKFLHMTNFSGLFQGECLDTAL